MSASTTITLATGQRFTFDHIPKHKTVKELVMAHCPHTFNTHASFRQSKKAKCYKCRFIIPR